MADSDPDGESAASTQDFDQTVDRAFTCSLCGFATTYEVGLLRAEVQSVCVNCGDWTVQTAAAEDLVDPAREAAAMLAGAILTERQALAYLLRDVVGFDRETAGDIMDSTPSNVDNLQRRGAEKVEAAREVVEGLDALLAPEGDVVDAGIADEQDRAVDDGSPDERD